MSKATRDTPLLRVVYDPKTGGERRTLVCECKNCARHYSVLYNQLHKTTCEDCQKAFDQIVHEPRVPKIIHEYTFKLPLVGYQTCKVKADNLKQAVDMLKSRKVSFISQTVKSNWSGEVKDLEVTCDGEQLEGEHLRL